MFGIREHTNRPPHQIQHIPYLQYGSGFTPFGPLLINKWILDEYGGHAGLRDHVVEADGGRS